MSNSRFAHTRPLSFAPSSADLEVLKGIKASVASTFVHVNRWLSHITSFSSSERSSFGGACAAAAAAAAPVEDANVDDFDPFADDADDGAAAAIAKKKAEEEAKKKAAKKDKPKPVARSTIIWDVKPEEAETGKDSERETTGRPEG
jgi:hypothetical protein